MAIKKKRSKAPPRKARKAIGVQHSKELFTNIWPSEREVLARPDRYKYVRKLIKTQECVFCEARNKGVGFESLIVYQSSLAMVVLNKFPYNTGHTLILPSRHCGELTDLSDEEYGEVMKLLRKTLAVLQKSYDCPGLNIGLNHGAVAGAGIPDHLHWHIIPRWHGDTNFFPLIAETKVLAETLEQTFQRLHPLFEEQHDS